MVQSDQFEPSLYNYVAYLDTSHGTSRPRIGQLHQRNQTIQPLSFASGTPLENLYQVIEAGERNIKPSGDSFDAESVKLLPPVSGRDVLAVGKNYSEHAKEFNSSGYDSSDKVDQPTHPVIFTKRATSIIAHGEEIYPHVGFTQSADYEGEIGVIIGKSGFRISEEDAMDHVWGYTIINDMTARERQRDHKQFYIGKSPDTFCPMGPIAVPASKLPKVLELQTHVNGELRQQATSEDLIFSIPFLIKTLSEGQTLQLGDVLATGTPAGVGIGKKPPVFLKPGDEIAISVTGLGTLRNKVSTADDPKVSRVREVSHIPLTNAARVAKNTELSTQATGKPLHYKTFENPSKPPIVFVHGLGGSTEYWTPLINKLKLDSTHDCHLFDLEGHGLSPTSPLSTLTISSLAGDLADIVSRANQARPNDTVTTIVAHGLGCLVALRFALDHPDRTRYLKLVLLGPPPLPLPKDLSTILEARASAARRTESMDAAADDTADELSASSRERNPLATAAVRLSVLGQDPEGYAKACVAFANANAEFGGKRLEDVGCETLIVTGERDGISTPKVCEGLKGKMGKVGDVLVLKAVGHWHVFEDLDGVAGAL